MGLLFHHLVSLLLVPVALPLSFPLMVIRAQQRRSSLRDPSWTQAMQDEFDTLIKNRTWELVPHSAYANVIRSL